MLRQLSCPNGKDPCSSGFTPLLCGSRGVAAALRRCQRLSWCTSGFTPLLGGSRGVAAALRRCFAALVVYQRLDAAALRLSWCTSGFTPLPAAG